MSLLNTVKEAGAVGPEFNVTPSLATLLGHLDEVAHPRPRLTSDVVGVQVPVGGYGSVAAPLTPIEELTRRLVSWHNQLVEARRELALAAPAQRRVADLERQLSELRATCDRATKRADDAQTILNSAVPDRNLEACRAALDTANAEIVRLRALGREERAAAAKKSSATRRAR
jgi:hypothetical protein